MQHDTYLESKILTAQPHRLHLMLIEGAIRFGRQAEHAMQLDDFAGAAAPLMRMFDVIGEMLVGVRKTKADINRKLADLYQFLLRRVTEARLKDDVAAIADVLQLLEYERQTWQLVCDKLGPSALSVSPPATPRPKSAITPPLGLNLPPASPSAFSFEA